MALWTVSLTLLCMAQHLMADGDAASGFGAVNWQAMTQSLPRVQGQAVIQGLEAAVEISRDDIGVPVIRAESFEDACRAQGFLHAQDRFFQMDGLRRMAAGELAELVGPHGLWMDRQYRVFGFRRLSEQMLQQLPERHVRMLRAYAEGVNAGLADLKAPPPEYVVLNAEPEPWRVEDSLLVGYVLFDMLHFDVRFEPSMGIMQEALSPEIFAFLTPLASRWDVPLTGRDEELAMAELPGPDVVNLREAEPLSVDWQRDRMLLHELEDWPPAVLGSNNWAVAGSRSVHGGAILANDPHLPISVPNVWYRVQMHWNGGQWIGASLPGVPGVLIGSNGHVAWGFTNTAGDFQDLIIIDVDPENPDRYRTPEGWENFGQRVETIKVRGGDDHTLHIRTTRWGAVTHLDWKRRPMVLKWTALDPSMVNVDIFDMAHARNVEEALEIGRRWWGPSQNLVVADHEGRIGWIVTGYLPQRQGFDGRVPMCWADGDIGWRGPLPETQRPMLLDPPDGVLFTANNRTCDIDSAQRIGSLYDVALRAFRIHEMLNGDREKKFSERDLLNMQLDTRSIVHDFYRDLILKLTAEYADADADGADTDSDEAAAFRQIRKLAEEWNGAADADQVGYRLLRFYRQALRDAVLAPLLEPVRRMHPAFYYMWLMEEEPVRRILEAQPMHLLPQPYESWEAMLRDRLLYAFGLMTDERRGLDPTSPWGEANRIVIRHPLSEAAPALSAVLDMPRDPMSGDRQTVRVTTQAFSASLRMVVSPGREEQGLFHMPCGQSGHPLSQHYRSSHAAWVHGRATPFLAGHPESRLRLVPSEQQE